MNNFKEQLEQYIDHYADRYSYDDGTPQELFKSGAHSIFPMLMVALEALHQYGQSSVYVGSEDCNISVAYNALNKIKQMIEVK